MGPRVGIPELGQPDRLRSDGNLRRRYAAEVVRRRTVNGTFAAKVHRKQYAPFLDNAEGAELFQGARFIHLYRRDLLGQAISRHIATLTGRWGPGDTATTAVQSNPDFFDNDAIARNVMALAQEDANWRLFFAQNGIAPLVMTYEELVADTVRCLRRIADAFALDLPTRDLDYAEPRVARPDAEPSRSAIREAFLRAHQRFTPAGWYTPSLEHESPHLTQPSPPPGAERKGPARSAGR